MEQQTFLMGCVADDFTGASDAASFLAANGVKTVLTNGIPNKEAQFGPEIQAVVIALKSRTQETSQAVADTLEAMDWLKSHGAQTLYFKYCSTFDSTPKGNIGPVIDADLEKYNIPYTVICPSLLANKRTVKDGILYVDQVPLAESHMKNHPLTPMWESDLVKLMEPQGKYPCFKINYQLLEQPEQAKAQIAAYQKEHPHFYLAVDFFQEDQGPKIMELFHDLPFLTGGSGLPAEFAKYMTHGAETALNLSGSQQETARLMFAGSCSVATRGQVKNWLESGGQGFMVSPSKLASGEQSVEKIWKFIQDNQDSDVLVYSAGSGGVVEQPGEGDAARLEQTMAALARKAAENGCTRLISAGGETSGAVTQALGYTSFYIGESVAPGVPVMVPTENTKLRLVLKSGNFGGPDFFLTTLA